MEANRYTRMGLGCMMASCLVSGACLQVGCRIFGRDKATETNTKQVQDTRQDGAQAAASGPGATISQNQTQTTSQSSKSVQNDSLLILGLVALGLFGIAGAAWLGDRRLKHWTRKHGYTPERWQAKERWRNGGSSRG